jgi:hypothetical protein
MASSYTFLSWVRQGAVSAIKTVDRLDPPLDSRVQMDVAVRLNGSNTDDAAVKARLYGPGDVTGFVARQVLIPTTPQHLTANFEPNFFPSVEFDRSDFPWLFTPAKANSIEQLRPWICLVVVEQRDNLNETDKPCPYVLTANAKTELPDLKESWAWAHAQVLGNLASPGDAAELTDTLTKKPECNLSRLLCPRKLQPNKSYYACVVPTFDVGRKAGLGEVLKDGEGEPDGLLKPAWDDTTGEIELPVYFHWKFATGAAGDFEALVWLLERRHLSSDQVGTRDLRVINPDPEGDPQADLPRASWPEIGVVPLEGALRAHPGSETSKDTVKELLDSQAYKDFQERLRLLLNKPAELQAAVVLPPGIPIAPPIYGRWHAAQRMIPDGARDAVWLRDLNLNPSLRAIAGIGTQIVQDQQEHLMASAWEQVGEIEKANKALRQAQMARSAGIMIYQQHLSQMAAKTLLHITGAVHARVRRDTQTLYSEVHASVVPLAAVSAPFRRVTRSRGPLARRMGATSGAWTSQLVEKLNNGTIKAVPSRIAPRGMVTMDEVFKKVFDPPDRQERFCTVTPAILARAPLPASKPAAFQELWRAFQRAAIAHQREMAPCDPPRPSSKPHLDLEGIKATLLKTLNPDVTVSARISARLEKPPAWKPEDPLEPIMVAPEFPTPMYKPLADLSQDLLLPGLEHVPPNTIALLETNPRFVEAVMIGLNHEMSRELLWREFPTDQRGTYFRQFWDLRGQVAQPADPEMLKDLKPIPEWSSNSPLGNNLTGDATKSQTVLLIRGDLLRRYPDAIIYAAKAEWSKAGGQNMEPRSPSTEEKYPIFRGTLSPDITFLGFDFDPITAKGDQDPAKATPGWFFVLQQPPTEPRFGLDASLATSDPNTWTWRDLSWKHVPMTVPPRDGVEERDGYIKLSSGLDSFVAHSDAANLDPPGITADSWSSRSNSAALAYITLQGPFRVAIHASDLLPI